MTPPLRVPLERLYRLFRKPLALVPPARAAIIAMVVAAIAIVGLAIAEIARRHEVIRLGFGIASASQRVRAAEEHNRLLELECATLTRPERIRALATGLGMVTPPPDRIRAIKRPVTP